MLVWDYIFLNFIFLAVVWAGFINTGGWPYLCSPFHLCSLIRGSIFLTVVKFSGCPITKAHKIE